MTRHVLLTGANGFIGRRLAVALAQRDGYSITATYRGSSQFLPPPTSSLSLRQLDIDDSANIDDIFRRVAFDAVINAAAALAPIEPISGIGAALRTNVMAQSELVRRAVEGGCRRYIYLSSISVYGGQPRTTAGWTETDPAAPAEPYGLTKFFGEQILQSMLAGQTETTGITLRLAGVHGPGKNGGVVWHLLRAGLAGEPLRISEPKSRFQLLFVDDAVAATICALDAPPGPAYRCFNIAGEAPASLRQIAEQIREATGQASDILEGDQGIARNQVMNISRAVSKLSYAPRPMPEHLRNFLSDIRAR